MIRSSRDFAVYLLGLVTVMLAWAGRETWVFACLALAVPWKALGREIAPLLSEAWINLRQYQWERRERKKLEGQPK